MDGQNSWDYGSHNYGFVAQQQDDETEALARAIEASLQEDLARKSRMLAQELVQKSRQESADMKFAQALDEQDDADRQLAQAVDESHALYEADRQRQSEKDLSQAMKRTIDSSQDFRSKERHDGSWDCTNCTFTNTPYRPKCKCCASPPPPNVLAFREIPPQMRFGCEIEILLPQGKRDGFTLETLAKQLTDLGPPSVKYIGYTHETTDYWKLVTDASVAGDDHQHDLGFELVSPVLQGEAGLVSLRTVMENIRRLGIATNRSCSFHVHVDAENGSEIGTLRSLKRVAQCFVSLENAFDLLVSLTWDGVDSARRADSNRFCRSNRLAFGERSNRQRWDDISSARSRYELVDQVNPNNDRYHKLNMTNIIRPSRPSTCEFRHHGGVDDMREAEAWVRLVVLFCQQAAQGESTACLLPESSPPKVEIRALFDLVNCAGLEQFFTIERRLFADNRLNNHWDCGVCRRNFTTSRGLAQHTAACGH